MSSFRSSAETLRFLIDLFTNATPEEQVAKKKELSELTLGEINDKVDKIQNNENEENEDLYELIRLLGIIRIIATNAEKQKIKDDKTQIDKFWNEMPAGGYSLFDWNK